MARHLVGSHLRLNEALEVALPTLLLHQLLLLRNENIFESQKSKYHCHLFLLIFLLKSVIVEFSLG